MNLSWNLQKKITGSHSPCNMHNNGEKHYFSVLKQDAQKHFQ